VRPVRPHQDTPPAAPARDSCGGRSPGSRVTAVDHLPRNTQSSQWHLGRGLAAYSCGGSRGIVLECTHRVPF
jgi:hypothetical protein